MMYRCHCVPWSRLPLRLALIWLLPLSLPAAFGQSASVSQITPFPYTAEMRVSPLNPAFPPGTVYLPLLLGSKGFLEGWTEYNTKTCHDISIGSYTATPVPKFGQLSYDIQNGTLSGGPCAGHVFPFNVAHYTWTKQVSSAPQDFFSLRWRTPDGKFNQNSDWLAELLPQSEATTFKGWAISYHPTMGLWEQTIQPPKVAYAAVTVQESDPGGGGPDTCWFAGSKFTPFTAITGGTWVVKKGNTWGFDYVGWFDTAVRYYRTKGRAPCGTTFPQQMQIKFATGDPKFYNYGTVNKLGGSFDKTTVTTIRAGKTMTKRWP